MRIMAGADDAGIEGVVIVLTKSEYATLVALAEATGACSEVREETWDTNWKEAFAWIDSLAQLVWKTYPIRLEGQSRERFEKSVLKYADFITNLSGDLNLAIAQAEPSDAQKLEAIEAYVLKKIMEPLAEARENLHNISRGVEESTSVERCKQWEATQRQAWSELQRCRVFKKKLLMIF